MLSRSQRSGRAVGRARATLSGLVAALVLVSYAGLAHADTSPNTPSQAQVDAAKAAVTDQQARIAALDSEYQQGAAQLVSRVVN